MTGGQRARRHTCNCGGARSGNGRDERENVLEDTDR